jgi:hypothetical protein
MGDTSAVLEELGIETPCSRLPGVNGISGLSRPRPKEALASYNRYMRLLLVATIVAVPVFVFLATWNSAVAVVFAIAALAFVLSTLYWRLGSADPFAGAITRGDGERRNRG